MVTTRLSKRLLQLTVALFAFGTLVVAWVAYHLPPVVSSASELSPTLPGEEPLLRIKTEIRPELANVLQATEKYWHLDLDESPKLESKKPVPIVPAPPAVQLPNLELVAVAFEGERSYAIIKESPKARMEVVRLGEELPKTHARIVEIHRTHVLFELNGRSGSIVLPAKDRSFSVPLLPAQE